MSCDDIGKKVLDEVYEPGHAAAIHDLASFCPDYYKIIQDFGLGELWQRQGLNIREKELVVIASLITMGDTEVEFRQHIHTAFKRDIMLDDILECLILLTVYIGVPRTLNAINVLRNELEQRK
ncbi:carboxymuconolactone decarboxylase family protein [Enterobacter sp. WCHEn045836]|uniref:carboxymuconolactone decarboxylase family protein n=1 Tax=Enterobacter sp. WCHEn045836 TaxID=2497434 RepID=UPI000F8411EF|nr:carboxymuconolactone decarboxylase family protein [Enterobacter sp. WCHEn045836]RTP93716.1 carboxymuconolactone decarboxylase family protein [Enterobacter sp. WCHEn045836]